MKMVSFKLDKTDTEPVCRFGLKLEEQFHSRSTILNKINLCVWLIVMLLTRAWFLFKWSFTHSAARTLVSDPRSCKSVLRVWGGGMVCAWSGPTSGP